MARRPLEQVIREGREGAGGHSPEVADANPGQDLYQGWGFAQGRLPDYYGPGQHAHRLVLALGGMSGRRHRRVARIAWPRPSGPSSGAARLRRPDLSHRGRRLAGLVVVRRRYLGQRPDRPAVCAGGSGLFLLHLAVFAWRKLGKRDI